VSHPNYYVRACGRDGFGGHDGCSRPEL
jgi:hypothetical protein